MLNVKWLGAVLMALVMADALASEVGLVTAVSGRVKLQEGKAAPSALKPFVKVRAGDHLLLDGASKLQVAYFEGGGARKRGWARSASKSATLQAEP